MDGTPCENPASRPDGRCHMHTDIGDSTDVGRNSKLTRERQESIVQLLEDGHSIAAACRCNGIDWATFYRWLEKAISRTREYCSLSMTDDEDPPECDNRDGGDLPHFPCYCFVGAVLYDQI